MLVSLGMGRHVSCLLGTDWTHIHSRLAGTRAACHKHSSTWYTLAFVLCLSHLASGVSLLPFLFPVVSPLSPCRAFCLLMSLVLKRASHPGDHVISKKPFGHPASCIVWVWREATKVCRQWDTMASCCCEQSKGWSCCPWVKMWFCGFTCIFQSEGLLESACKNCT